MHDMIFYSDEVFILGAMQGAPVNSPNIIINRYRASGDLFWSKPIYSCISDNFYSSWYDRYQLLLTADARVIVGGSIASSYVCFSDTAIYNIDATPGFFVDRSKLFLLELNLEGEQVGVNAYGSEFANSSLALLQGSNGNLINVGEYSSTDLSFDTHDLTNDCWVDTFVVSPIHGFFGLRRKTLAYLASFSGTIITSKSPNVGKASFALFPNPSQDHFFLRSEAFTESPVQVQIFSTDGKLLSQQNLLPNGNSLRVETGTLPPGMYIANIIVDQQLSAQRFVKY